MDWRQVKKAFAITCGLGQHTVSSIVAESRQNLGNGDAEALRELAINMKSTGIDAAAQCAQGFKIFMIMRKMRFNEEAFKSFISKVYEQCQKVGLASDKIGSYLIWLYFQLVANALAISYSVTHSKVITHLPLIFIKEYIIKFIFLPVSLRYQQITHYITYTFIIIILLFMISDFCVCFIFMHILYSYK